MLIDAEHLYIVLNIIIGNAIKYTDKGYITIHIKNNSSHDKQHPQFIKIIVSDTGPGIHADQLKTIFNGFAKEHTNFSNHYRKPSVRLPYAKLLIQHALKGELTIQTLIGEGSSVTINAPYKKTDTDSEQESENQKQPFKPLHILLVEDNDVSRRLEGEMLRNLGYIVEEASTGNEAIAKAKQRSFDFIFLDITLPDMNGIQVFDSIQETQCSETPVIALTSHATEEDIDTFLNKKMLTVMAKPVSIDALKAFFDSYNKSLND